MARRIITNETANGATYVLANERGDLARTTGCEVFITSDIDLATRAMNYLNGVKGVGGHQLKSMFGKRI